MSELKNAIFSQSNNKSCGLDRLPAEIYKHSFELISPCLLACLLTIMLCYTYLYLPFRRV